MQKQFFLKEAKYFVQLNHSRDCVRWTKQSSFIRNTKHTLLTVKQTTTTKKIQHIFIIALPLLTRPTLCALINATNIQYCQVCTRHAEPLQMLENELTTSTGLPAGSRSLLGDSYTKN